MMKTNIKTREILKGYFETGSLPSTENFGDLIDSLVHRDDLNKVVIEEELIAALKKELLAAITAREAAYHAIPYPYKDVWFFAVEANAQWHPILSMNKTNGAFEIVAEVISPQNPYDQATTHATAVISLSALPNSIRQTFSYGGWIRGRRIMLEWKKVVDEGTWFQQLIKKLFRRDVHYTLCIRTGRKYGKDENGDRLMIYGRITQYAGPTLEETQKRNRDASDQLEQRFSTGHIEPKADPKAIEANAPPLSLSLSGAVREPEKSVPGSGL